jgi:DNA-binding transcriptional regulator/RsmH inhibitor MraZ
MDESETAISIEQKSRIILPAEKKDVFAKQDRNRK